MIYNIIIDVVGALIVGVIFFAELRHRKNKTPDTRLLNLLMVSVLLIFVSDIPGLLLDGRHFDGANALLWISDTLYWLIHGTYGFLWLLFADARLFRSKERLKRVAPLYSIPMIAEAVLALTNPLTGWIFTINPSNEYVVGSAYYLCMSPFFCYILAAIVLTIGGYFADRTQEQKRRCLSLIIFMFLPICGVILEIAAYGISWVWPLTALSLLIIYVNVQQQYIADRRLEAAREKENNARLESELIDSENKIMLSQIQPNFLYSSLAAIKRLCREDSKAAGSAINAFSSFLRGNMDSLTLSRPIPFERELEHTKNYLALVRLCYGDSFKTEYDIKAVGFCLPSLTLQPLVEYAVMGEGGTLRIASDEDEKKFVVTVSFSGSAPRKTDGAFVGIENAENRVKTVCGGTLTINGGTATVTLPKGDEEDEQQR